MPRTLVLGGGFGGLSVATELRRRLGDAHEVVLIDRREDFMMGLRKPWAAAGYATLEDGRRSRTLLASHGVRFVQADILSIEPGARRVETDAGAFDGDYLVVALGAEPRPDLVPGLAEHAHDLYDASAIPALREAIERFDGGSVLIVIAGAPYRCPPAPYECAMLLDARFRERDIRERTAITVTTLQPILMPNAGKEASTWLGEQLDARGIAHRAGAKVVRVEPGRVVYEHADVESDVVIGVPPHRPPPVVGASGLTGGGDWIAVDPATLRTSFDGVYAIGDNTHIPLANGLPLPKAGIFAELEGLRVAADIAATEAGGPPAPDFSGVGYCFVEMGPDTATLVEGDFFARPEPRIALRGVSAENSAEKHAFERERLARWFGG